MAAINFPTGPLNGDIYTENGATYEYETATTSWLKVPSTWINDGAFVYYNGALNVGIGTITPSTKLHVVGTTLLAGEVDITGDFAVDTDTFWVNVTNNRIGMGTVAPTVTLDIQGTDAVLLPVGTTAQRPTGAAGMIRYNSTNGGFEGYTSTWGAIGGGTSTSWELKTTTYTAVAGDAIIANTSGGIWTLTLPITPTTGDIVQILDGADWSVNNLTVARNGQTIESDAEDMVMNVGGVSVDFIFDGTTWQIAIQMGPVGGVYVTETGTQTLTNKTLTSAILGGTTTAGPINVTGTVAATDFTGDGSLLTGIAAGIEWALKTTTYTAVTRDAIIANTSGGIWTLTLPITPATGDYVQILDGADWATNNLTVARNGQTIEGDAEDMIMNIGGVSVDFVFDGTTWQITTQVGGQSGDGVTLTGTQTLTNKTIDLSSNVISGTTAQFNTSLTDDDFTTLTGTETLTNKTLTAPILTGTTTVDALVVNTNNYPSAGSLSGRNRIINGDFGIWRRATSGSGAGDYVADRWVNSVGGGATKTITRTTFALGQTDVPNDPQYYASSVVVGNAATSSFAIDDQRIENVRTFNGRNVTTSFWCKADSPKNIAFGFEQVFGTGGSPSATVDAIGPQLIAVTASWAKYTVTVAIPSISGKTLGSDGNDRLAVLFWYSAGTDFTARTGGLTTQSGTFDLAQVQIEEGDVATPFERVDTGLELAKCQRYWQRFGYRARFGATGAGEEDGRKIPFPVQMRAAPTASQTFSTSVNVSSTTFVSTDGVVFTAGVTPTAAGGTDWNGILTWDAEL